MKKAEVEAIERATVQSVAPLGLLELDGWLIPLDDGAIGRAKSAAPLRHDAGPASLDAIEAAYRTEGLPPAFRIADLPGLQAVRDELVRRGYAPARPTLFMVGQAAASAAASAAGADLLAQPDAAWGQVFCGEGFDPADGASRVAGLRRVTGTLYGQVSRDGAPVAVGVASYGYGWAAVSGMRTAAASRGQGFATAILAAFARAAMARGVDRMFLQVEQSNPARALYRRLGLSDAWTYRYWG